jgi:uncharacterized membrane protein SpoIIM required for sporulation
MKVSDRLEQRRPQWEELENLCDELARTARPRLTAPQVLRLGALYRAACADLALAYAYQLPQSTIQYLHRLVGRAHNQLYRSQPLQPRRWAAVLLRQVPRQVFQDPCVQAVFCVFWGLFVLAAYLAYDQRAWPQFAEQVLGADHIQRLEEMYRLPLSQGRGGEQNLGMAGFYLYHNTGIGLRCFAWGLLVIPGLLLLITNAITLGASFGYMARPEAIGGEHFFEFVMAHGPFELTAIVLSAGAGLRLGLAWIITHGLSRRASLVQAGQQTLPVMGTAVVLFALAALIEGFVSPSAAPYAVKAGIAVASSLLLAFYFVVLGQPTKIGPAEVSPGYRHPLRQEAAV